ncbi:MAG: protein translocase subunit SecD [Planctomycetes bacterium]|nr:protein translocase subunit SecD [Planctomycetota bacterium]NOG53653.1 protein translocase subunit SecD [Planctomycetota bacterium]
MKNYIVRVVIVVLVVGICALMLYPPKERLKLGKDLAGGTTLTYGIKADSQTGKPPSSAEIDQLTSVIRDRIDPKGIYDISIVAVGTNQIEISMPSPTEEVRQLKREFDELLAELRAIELSEADVDELVRMDATARAGRIDELSAGVPDRRPLLDEVVSAYDLMIAINDEYLEVVKQADEAVGVPRQLLRDAEEEMTAIRERCRDQFLLADALLARLDMAEDEAQKQELIEEQITNAVAQGAVEEDVRQTVTDLLAVNDRVTQAQASIDEVQQNWNERVFPLEERAGQADLAYEEARRAVVATSLDNNELIRVLALDQTPLKIKNLGTGRWEDAPSARESALNRLNSRFQILSDRITQIVTAYDAYKSKAKGYDDPKDLIALLRGAGVLEFRIAASLDDQLPPIDTLRDELRKRGPRLIQSTDQVKWFPLDTLNGWYDRPEQLEWLQADPFNYFRNRYGVLCEMFDGQIYMLLYDTPDRSMTAASGEWKVSNAYPSQDQTGLPAINFEMDAQGAIKLGQLTGNNIQRPMAIVLDDRVYSAPNLRDRISANGQITGRFSQEEVTYLLKVLNSGALQAKMTEQPIAQQTIGPKLGLDNLQRGLEAGVLALIIVAIFMLVYYFFAGAVANVALICNAIIILGAMSLYEAAFTMPGIAGIVLTFGMAVDANVLIYERIREELEGGADLPTAIKLGYEKVFSTIIDANVTNLIVCFVLAFTATAEVRGFGLTLGIGIVATLFSALFITRIIFELYANVFGAQSLPMLPTVWRGLNRALNPNISWVNLRVAVWTVSGIVVAASIGLTSMYWNEMLDTEFLGGTSVTFQFRVDDEGNQITMPRSEVEQTIHDYAQEQYDAGTLGDDPELADFRLKALQNAAVFNLNVDEIEGSDFSSASFVVKSTVTQPQLMEQVIVEAFGARLDIKQPILFEGSDIEEPELAPVYPIIDSNLGEVINDSSVTNDVRRFSGGAAVVLRDLSPISSLVEVSQRISRLRQTQEFEKYFGREIDVIGLTRASERGRDNETLWQDVVVLISDENVNVFQRLDEWEVEMRDIEWTLIRRALTSPPSLDQVTTVSPQVAEQFRAKAIVAILLSLAGILAYIWVRFGSFRYSMAAIIALMHDVCVTLGLLALTHVLYSTVIGQALYIEAFKIDLGVIAALLTIIGYSLNDTIVILDRIRENRGKLAVTSMDVVNRSINQTISRTLLTSGTTLLAVIIMYVEGGTGIRPFTFAMLCGVLVGTYSSIGIAAPMVYRVAAGGSSGGGSSSKYDAGSGTSDQEQPAST